MAHYAHVEDGRVVNVICISDNSELVLNKIENNINGELIKTSYNTERDKHVKNDEKEPLRKNYAGVGYIYDEEIDAFYPPQPFDSWILDEEKCVWKPPNERPNDSGQYSWDEKTSQWIKDN